MNTIGTRINYLRETISMTQQEFSDTVGVARGYISTVETDKQKPSNQFIKAISLRFGVREEWLRTGEEPMYRSVDDVVEETLERYGVDFIRVAIDKAKARGLYGDLQPKDIITVEDIELNQMMNYLTDTWRNGDHRTKIWLSVQFEKSFPEFNEYLQKNNRKIAGCPSNGA